MSETTNSTDRDIAKELVIHAIEHGYNFIRHESVNKPEAVGKDIADLYNSILKNISKPQ